MSKVIGIDLGTTNSCVATLENGEAVIIANAEGARTTPSVVAFSGEGERLVGITAKRQAVTNNERTIVSVKREMGTDWKMAIDKSDYTPQEVSAFILQKLKADAEAYLGHQVDRADIALLDPGILHRLAGWSHGGFDQISGQFIELGFSQGQIEVLGLTILHGDEW